MINQFKSPSERAKVYSKETTKDLLNNEHRVRRLLEMQRRVRSLQVKRNHLRNELQAVEKSLESLDSQIQSHEAYEQLVFNK